LLRHVSSEFVGVCVDTGNSIALLEDPLRVVESFAPWAFSVHLKDQAVAEHADGFLLADVPLGQGLLDLRRMVDVLRKAKPDVRFCLELITRDPLLVTCLTEKYWKTMEGVSGSELARTLRTVRERAAKELPRVDALAPNERASREEANIKASLVYARDFLSI
jgi:sugar phosphate isomerase/epimerase